MGRDAFASRAQAYRTGEAGRRVMRAGATLMQPTMAASAIAPPKSRSQRQRRVGLFPLTERSAIMSACFDHALAPPRIVATASYVRRGPMRRAQLILGRAGGGSVGELRLAAFPEGGNRRGQGLRRHSNRKVFISQTKSRCGSDATSQAQYIRRLRRRSRQTGGGGVRCPGIRGSPSSSHKYLL